MGSLPHLGASDGAAVGHGVHGKAMRALPIDDDLRAPFPWFGGKSRAAPVVWERFGDVANYIEPFAGSLAVPLARPTAPRVETVNDLDCYLANFWRCLSALSTGCEYTGRSGEEVALEVASFADWPVNEADLHSRHRWLVTQSDFRERMRADPFYFDAHIAGWWVWGLCAWIGSGWCDVGRDPPVQLPEIGGGESAKHGGNGEAARHGKGVHAKIMREQLPHVGDAGRGTHSAGVRSALHETFARLAARLRYVRVACGDWQRVLTDSVTWRHGTTGILLDPPYGDGSGRAEVYAHDSATVAADVRAWCLEHGPDKRLRICLCGYEGEGHEELVRAGWNVVEWKAQGGYGGQRKRPKGGVDVNENARRERLFFSPGCDRGRQGKLF